jgi:hypothetical protein
MPRFSSSKNDQFVNKQLIQGFQKMGGNWGQNNYQKRDFQQQKFPQQGEDGKPAFYQNRGFNARNPGQFGGNPRGQFNPNFQGKPGGFQPRNPGQGFANGEQKPFQKYNNNGQRGPRGQFGQQMAQPNHFDGYQGMMGQGARFQKNFSGYQHGRSNDGEDFNVYGQQQPYQGSRQYNNSNGRQQQQQEQGQGNFPAHLLAQENLFENDAFRASMPGLFQLVRKNVFDQNCGE